MTVLLKEKRSLHQRTQNTQEVKCSQLLPGGTGWGGVGESGPGSRPSLFQVYLIENFTLKRVLHGTLGSCQTVPQGRRLTAPRTSREKPSKSEAPGVPGCGFTGGGVTGCASLQEPGDFTVYGSELTLWMERSV